MHTDSLEADREDLLALQNGDDIALNRLMDRHSQRIFHFLFRLLQNEGAALDLAQETFVRLYLNRHKLSASQRLTSWLYTVAGNMAKDQLRRDNRRQTVSLDTPISSGDDRNLGEVLRETKRGPDLALEHDERVGAVRKAIAELPEDLREPLILVEYEDLSQAEIADILKCTRKSVENRIYRARKLLREKLGSFMSAEKQP